MSAGDKERYEREMAAAEEGKGGEEPKNKSKPVAAKEKKKGKKAKDDEDDENEEKSDEGESGDSKSDK